MTAWAARFGAVLIFGALAFGGAATATLVGSGNPTGRWATPGAIQAIILSHRLDVGECRLEDRTEIDYAAVLKRETQRV